MSAVADTQTSCVFCKIINKELPAQIIAENNQVVVIKDIAPKAPIHYLIIPKKHLPDVMGLSDVDTELMSALLLMARQIGHTLGQKPNFRLIINNGTGVGQSVFHLHVHLIAGKQLSDF